MNDIREMYRAAKGLVINVGVLLAVALLLGVTTVALVHRSVGMTQGSSVSRPAPSYR